MIAQAERNQQLRELKKKIEEEEEKRKKKGLGGLLGTGLGAALSIPTGGLSLAAGAALGGAAGTAAGGGSLKDVIGSGIGGYSAGKLGSAFLGSDMGKELLPGLAARLAGGGGKDDDIDLEEAKKLLDLEMSNYM
jgi:hypothetical protein